MSKYSIDIEGNLGHDASTRYTDAQQAITEFSIGIGARAKDKNTGEWYDVPDPERPGKNLVYWFTVKFFGDCPVFHQGDTVHVIAKARTETWTDRQSGAPRSKLVFIADTIELIRRKGERSAPAPDDYGEPLDMGELSPGD